jgi:hypothetical protein
MEDSRSISILSLIKVPAVITLGITILRLIGEMQHWPRPWFANQGGGGGALVGISWLPFILGPYYAIKLMAPGNDAPKLGRAIGFAILALAVFLFAGWLFQSTIAHPSVFTALALALMLGAAFVPGIGWSSLGTTLVAYAFAARIPVLLVMYLAMRGNGGAGWGTHYDATLPQLLHLSFAKKYFYEAILPQMTMWIGWTVIVGFLFGVAAAGLARSRKRRVEAAA